MDSYFPTKVLISSVQQYPCLWRYKDPKYTDKECRTSAWKKIGSQLVPGFDEKSDADQFLDVRELQSKWKSVKDSFQRDVRNSQNATADDAEGKRKKKRPYVYSDCLKFLMENYEDKNNLPDCHYASSTTPAAESFSQPHPIISVYVKEELVDNNSLEYNPDYGSCVSSNVMNSSGLSIRPEGEDQQRMAQDIGKAAKKRKMDSSFEENLLHLLERNNPSVVSDQDADKFFLLSQLPYFARMSTNQKIWARVQITKVISTALQASPTQQLLNDDDDEDENNQRPLSDGSILRVGSSVSSSAEDDDGGGGYRRFTPAAEEIELAVPVSHCSNLLATTASEDHSPDLNTAVLNGGGE